MMQKIQYCCPKHISTALTQNSNKSYLCASGCEYSIEINIPRFVSKNNYASSFGYQWNKYRTTQLDSYTGLTISRDRITRLLGGSLKVLNGKNVLEAGCGAGRFSEILLDAGAHLHAVDLSTAVEANSKNCSHFSNYSVCQASILELPFSPEQFDIVICVGVIQHTPNPELTMEALCRQVKPGGVLIIDHYSYGNNLTQSRKLFRYIMLKFPNRYSLLACNVLTNVLWPLHRLLWRWQRLLFVSTIREYLLLFSPLLDYHDVYPQLGPEQLKIWATLDTHDTITDYYKHLRSADEIDKTLSELGMTQIKTVYAGNGVEASAQKPVRSMEA